MSKARRTFKEPIGQVSLLNEGQQAVLDNRAQPTRLNRVTTGFDPEDYSRTNLDLSIQGGERALQEGRALDQSWYELVGKGVGNVIGTAAFEALKLPGYIAGVDNMYLDSVKYLQDQTQGKLFEVFTPPSVEGTDLLNQLKNPYFWASEGANGIGFMLSFMLPGQLLKAAGIGNTAATAIGKLGKLQDAVVDGQKLLSATGDTNMLGRLLLKSAGRTGRALDFGGLSANIESGTAVLTNAFFEASAEGAEIYDQLIAQGRSEQQASEAAAGVFRKNLPLLLLSNTLVEKYIMGGFGRLVNPSTGLSRISSQAVSGAADVAKISAVKQLPLALAGGVAQEGLLEEGLQSSISQTEGRSFGEAFSKYMQNLDQMWSGEDQDATDFGKAVVLGGLLGAGMSTAGSIAQTRRDNEFIFGSSARSVTPIEAFFGRKNREESPGALSILRNAHSAVKQDVSTLFNADANGKITGFKQDAKELHKDAAAMQILSNYYQDLVTKHVGNTKLATVEFVDSVQQATGKQQAVNLAKLVGVPEGLQPEMALKFMQHRQDLEYFSKFLRFEGGDELLQAHIDQTADVIQERYEKNTGVKMAASKITELKSDLSKQAKATKEAFDTVNADHHLSRLQVNYLDGVAPEDQAKATSMFKDFFARAKAGRIEALADMKFLEGQVDPAEPEPIIKNSLEYVEGVYKELSSTKGLTKAWKELWSGAVEARAKEPDTNAPTANPVVPMNKEAFWASLAEAGYDVAQDDNNYYLLDKEDPTFNYKGKMYTVTPTADNKGLTISSFNDPTTSITISGLSELATRFPGLQFVPKSQLLETRRKQEEQKQKDKLNQEIAAFRTAIGGLQSSISRKQEQRKQALEQSNERLSELKDQFKELGKKRPRKADKVTELKAIKTKLEAEINQLEETIQNISDEIALLTNQQTILNEFSEAIKAGGSIKDVIKERRVALEELEADPDIAELIKLLPITLAKLQETVTQGRKLVTNATEVLNELKTTLAIVNELLQAAELPKTYGATEALAEKYTYTDAVGQVRPLVKGMSDSKLISHLRGYAVANNQDFDQVVKDFEKDLRINELFEKGLDLTNILDQTNAEIETAAKQIAVQQKLNKVASLKLELLAFNSLAKQLTDTVTEVMKATAGKAETATDSDPDVGNDDGNYAGAFEERKLPVELLGTTGQVILHRDNKDVTEIDDLGIEFPVMHPSPYQQAFAHWIAGVGKINFKVRLQVAYYDSRDGDMEQHFLAYNTESRRPGEDVFSIIVDKNNTIQTSNGLPLMAAIYRTETKFPTDSGNIRMAPVAMYNEYFAAIGVPAISLDSFNSSSTAYINGITKTARATLARILGKNSIAGIPHKELLKNLKSSVVEWARNTHEAQLQLVREKGSIVTTAYGITNGHPVTLKQNGEPLHFSVIQSLGLQFDEKGKPKNFSLAKADKFGFINVTATNKLGGFKPGILYVKLASGQHVPIQQDNLTPDEVDAVLFMLSQLHDKAGLKITTGAKDTKNAIKTDWKLGTIRVGGKEYGNNLPIFPGKHGRVSVMTTLFNWGKGNNSDFDVFVHKGILFYGKQTISLAELNDLYTNPAKDTNYKILALKTFLATKRKHANYNLVEAGNSVPGITIRREGDTVVIEPSGDQTYTQQVLERATTLSPPQDVLEARNLPRYVQRNLQLTLVSKASVTVVAKKESSDVATTTTKSPTTYNEREITAELVKKPEFNELRLAAGKVKAAIRLGDSPAAAFKAFKSVAKDLQADPAVIAKLKAAGLEKSLLADKTSPEDVAIFLEVEAIRYQAAYGSAEPVAESKPEPVVPIPEPIATTSSLSPSIVGNTQQFTPLFKAARESSPAMATLAKKVVAAITNLINGDPAGFKMSEADYKLLNITKEELVAITDELLKDKSVRKALEASQRRELIPYDAIRYVMVRNTQTPVTQPVTESKPVEKTVEQKTINVYWGQAESATSTRILSNLAPRKFMFAGKEFGSVEHAYQSLKSGTFDAATHKAYTAVGGYGKKIRGKGSIAELKAANSLELMKTLVVESFVQNLDSEATVKLLEYTNYTHNTNELIDQAFLEGLQLARTKVLSLKNSTEVVEKTVEQKSSRFAERTGRTPIIKKNVDMKLSDQIDYFVQRGIIRTKCD